MASSAFIHVLLFPLPNTLCVTLNPLSLLNEQHVKKSSQLTQLIGIVIIIELHLVLNQSVTEKHVIGCKEFLKNLKQLT